MDAAHKLIKNIALFLALALLVAVPGRSQSQLSASPSSVALFSPGGTFQQVAVSGSGPFSITNQVGSFFSVSSDSSTAPATLTVGLVSTLCSNGGTTACSGSFTLHPTSATGGGTDVVVPVTFTPGGGGGGTGAISANPSSVTFNNAVTGTTYTQTVALLTSSTTPISFSLSPSTTWLQQSYILSGTNQVSASSPVTLVVFVNTSGITSSTSGSISIVPSNGAASTTISVTLNIGTSGGSTYNVSQTSVSLAYPSGPTSQFISISSNNSAVTTFNAYVTGCTSTSFLLVNGSTFVSSQAVAGGLNLTLTNLSALGTGSYSCQALVYNPTNSADAVTITVTLTANGGGSTGFSASPTSLSFSTPVGVVPAQQYISVTAPSSSSTFTASLQAASGSIFVVAPCNGCTYTGGQQLFVSVSPGSLGAGTYTNYITLSSGGTSFAFITVTLVVGGSGTTSTIAAPTSLSFYYQTGQASPPAQTITIAPSGSFTATATSSQNWLVVSPGSGNGPGNLIVSVIPQSFTAGSTQQGTISINTPSGTQAVNVSLTVTSGMVLYANPGTISLTTPNYQSVLQISASDNSSQQVTASTQTPWLSLSSPTNGGSTPVSYLVTVTPTGLCNGLNTGSITATTAGAANSPLTIPVTVLITGSSNTSCTSSSGPLTLSASSLTFTGAVNGVTPPTQILSVTTPSTSTFFTVSTSVQTGNWLSNLSCTSCTGNQNLLIYVNQSGLSAGTYQGTIYLYTNGTAQQVGVTLTVGTSGSTGNISLSTNSLSFTAQLNGSTPGGQTVQVSSSTSGVGYTYQVATNDGASWLSASANGTTLTNGQGLTTPTTLTVNVNSSILGAGSYTGTITLSPNGGTQVTITVSLSVQNNVVSASPTSLTFTYTAGSTAPSPQTVTVSSGTPGLAFSAQVSPGNCASGWLVASPASGTTQASVSVSVNPAGLTAGTCNGSVTISGTSGSSGSTTVSVSLTVTAPLPTITQVGSAASYLGSSMSPGEIITIFGTGLGPTPFVTLALDSSGKVTTTLGGVQVLVAGFPAPMVFAGNTQVSAVVPYEVARLLGSQPVVVKFLGQTSNAIGVQMAAVSPGIFTANASGTGPGAILNQNSSVNSPSNPAAKGSTVSIYMTGEGVTSPTLATGSVTTATLPPPQVTPAPLLPVAVLIDGQPASIAYAGEAPGLVAGVMQVNVVIPAGARTGDLPLVVSVGGTASQTGVTVSVH